MKRRLGIGSWIALAIGTLYFVIPLLATFLFSLKTTRHGHDLSAYGHVLRDPAFREALEFSLKLAISAVLVSTLLLVPTAYWVHLRLPWMRPFMDFMTLLPLVIPPIVLVVGLAEEFQGAPGWVFGEASWTWDIPPILVGGYTILAFPYVYRSIDAGLRAIDIHTLTDASLSLGASWPTTILRVIVPNLRPAVVNAAFLTVAIVLGEFTIAQLLNFTSFAVYISGVGQRSGTDAAALTLIAFALTWLAMIGLLVFARTPGGRRPTALVATDAGGTP